jgi:hypothetical protein
VDESSDVMARYASDGCERAVKTWWSLAAMREAPEHEKQGGKNPPR